MHITVPETYKTDDQPSTEDLRPQKQEWAVDVRTFHDVPKSVLDTELHKVNRTEEQRNLQKR